MYPNGRRKASVLKISRPRRTQNTPKSRNAEIPTFLNFAVTLVWVHRPGLYKADIDARGTIAAMLGIFEFLNFRIWEWAARHRNSGTDVTSPCARGEFRCCGSRAMSFRHSRYREISNLSALLHFPPQGVYVRNVTFLVAKRVFRRRGSHMLELRTSRILGFWNIGLGECRNIGRPGAAQL